MNNSSAEDRLTISTVPALYRIAGGMSMGFFGMNSILLGIWVATYEGISRNDIYLCLVLALFGVLILLFGAYMLSPHWGTITFVRSMGDVTMIKREILRQKTDRFPLSAIKGVSLVAFDYASSGQEINIPHHKVELVMNSLSSMGIQPGMRLVITAGSTNSQRKNADAIAAFLGFLPQYEKP